MGGSLRTRILYATNGSRPARDTGSLLRRLADPERVEVTVNVCDSVEFTFPEPPWRYGEERKPRAQPPEVAEQELSHFRADGFEVDSHLGSGVPATQIIQMVESGKYSVAAMGAGSTKWLDSLLLGSTSTRVLHSSQASVLLVHRLENLSDSLRVLLATDGSADAQEAIATFVGIAEPGKVAVKVVAVAETVPKVHRMVPESLPSSRSAEHLQEAARNNAERAAGPLRDGGFKVAIACPTGDPVREILQLSADADLVVCGSRGLGGASRLFLGSVSDQLARLAPATLVCRSSGREVE